MYSKFLRLRTTGWGEINLKNRDLTIYYLIALCLCPAKNTCNDAFPISIDIRKDQKKKRQDRLKLKRTESEGQKGSDALPQTP